jgi:hypothetical protein
MALVRTRFVRSHYDRAKVVPARARPMPSAHVYSYCIFWIKYGFFTYINIRVAHLRHMFPSKILVHKP